MSECCEGGGEVFLEGEEGAGEFENGVVSEVWLGGVGGGAGGGKGSPE